MIKGTTVTVLRPIYGEADRLGNPTVTEWQRETVHNVVVAPVTTTSLEAARPEGVLTTKQAHFPKAYTKSLEGCRVELPGTSQAWRVIGDPHPYMNENCPTPWNRPVDLEACHG